MMTSDRQDNGFSFGRDFGGRHVKDAVQSGAFANVGKAFARYNPMPFFLGSGSALPELAAVGGGKFLTSFGANLFKPNRVTVDAESKN